MHLYFLFGSNWPQVCYQKKVSNFIPFNYQYPCQSNTFRYQFNKVTFGVIVDGLAISLVGSQNAWLRIASYISGYNFFSNLDCLFFEIPGFLLSKINMFKVLGLMTYLDDIHVT
jgi:hypothetical protein